MNSTASLDHWRSYFKKSNSDIFSIIDNAIMVAASDCPMEFRLRRDAIAERLFSCRLSRCCGCDRVELAVDGGGGKDGGGCRKSGESEVETGGSKESKVNSSRDERGEVNIQIVSNYSYGEAEALTDEIEEQSQYADEVFRIRQVLLNSQEESDTVLFESLRRLQLMDLTVDLLKATEIGKAVTPLRKHGLKDIRQLARTLIDGWKVMVDEWVKATTSITGSEGTPDSVNPSVVDEEEGLPSPPMDEGAFFATQAGSMELSQFFDGMDDYGNPQQSGEFIKNRESGRRASLDNKNMVKMNIQASTDNSNTDSKHQLAIKHAATGKLSQPVSTDSGPGRPPKSTVLKKGAVEPKMPQKIETSVIRKQPQAGHQNKSKPLGDSSLQVKLEAAKRKLQERYQQAENAKRQRTVQVMELHDLPKQAVAHRNPQVKPGIHKRKLNNGQR
ncbi:hypothetical protein PIB30_005001 [Stylosanthes scabra]|uniref:TFIIS N-terminal domain-containing protein n=1 Tax=Stylosanthes scabra TaxID=79078 RepID=A0ABU6Y227_9FABA|nr:hypothetical protein [Stylosanthes scabra]